MRAPSPVHTHTHTRKKKDSNKAPNGENTRGREPEQTSERYKTRQERGGALFAGLSTRSTRTPLALKPPPQERELFKSVFESTKSTASKHREPERYSDEYQGVNVEVHRRRFPKTPRAKHDEKNKKIGERGEDRAYVQTVRTRMRGGGGYRVRCAIDEKTEQNADAKK